MALMAIDKNCLLVSIQNWICRELRAWFVHHCALKEISVSSTSRLSHASSVFKVGKLIVDIAIGKEAEFVCKHCVEENIWT